MSSENSTPFLCPCCGARGTTDGTASTVKSEGASPVSAGREALRSTLEDIIAVYEWCSVDPVDRGYSSLDSEIHRAKHLLADSTVSPQVLRCAIADIASERQRQINEEGWTVDHDNRHCNGELAVAAGWYALNSPFVGKPECIGDPSNGEHEAYRLFTGDAAMRWPWSRDWWKPKNQRRDLVRAGALIVAEIERLDRATLPRAELGTGGGK